MFLCIALFVLMVKYALFMLSYSQRHSVNDPLGYCYYFFSNKKFILCYCSISYNLRLALRSKSNKCSSLFFHFIKNTCDVENNFTRNCEITSMCRLKKIRKCFSHCLFWLLVMQF